MKFSGAYSLPLAPERAYQMMQDPEVLSRAIPGCQSLEQTGESEYRMKMTLVLASLSGAFEGRVRITEQSPPSSFRLFVEGSGRIGFLKGEGLLKIQAADRGAQVSYEGEAQVGGTIAAVGQRLIDGTARMMIKKFFERLSEAAT